MIESSPRLFAPNRMGVVEPGQAFASRSMQSQRIVEAMRPFDTNRNLSHDEPYPMSGFWIDHQNLPVQVEQSVEGQISFHLSSIITK